VVRVRVCLRRRQPQSTNPTIEAYGGLRVGREEEVERLRG
jgi:hypothetical protein